MIALGAACGAVAGFGLFLAALGLRGTAADVVPARRYRRIPWPRLAAATLAAAVVGAATGWVVAAGFAAALALGAPRLLGGRVKRSAAVARTEAVASWAEMLRDTLAAAAGLEQAVVATAALAPPPIRPEVAFLAADLQAGSPVPEALARFAEATADPTADLVAVALRSAACRQAGNLGALLGALAASAREQASLALRTEASRARTRTAVRVVSATTVALAGVLALIDRGYLAPYGTAGGQVVLAFVGSCFAFGLWWLARLADAGAPARLLAWGARERR